MTDDPRQLRYGHKSQELSCDEYNKTTHRPLRRTANDAADEDSSN